MVLTADKKVEYREGVDLAVPVGAGEVIYAGALVCVGTDGYGVPTEDLADLQFEGVARSAADNSDGLDGDASVIVRRRGLFKMTFASTLAQSDVGAHVFAVDDETAGLAGDVTYGVYLGVIAEFIDSTHAWVDIEPALKSSDVTAHIADPSAAHGASAISLADADNHFNMDNAEAAIAQLAKAVVLTFSAAAIATAASDDAIAEDFELPFPVRVKRVYATLSDAPGTDKTLTVEIDAGGGDETLVAVEGTAVKAEAEALDIAIPANTDFDIKLTQDSGAAAGLNLMLVCQHDDGV